MRVYIFYDLRSIFYTGNFTFSSKLRNAEPFLFSTTRYVVINYTNFFAGSRSRFSFFFFFTSSCTLKTLRVAKVLRRNG